VTTPSDPTARLLGEKIFSENDQQLFAELSGDRNPMHMDATAARRLITGRQVVHGVHVFLNALELWSRDKPAFAAHIECNFNNPVSVGDRVSFLEKEDEQGNTVIEASVSGLVCAHVTLSAQATAPDRRAPPAPAGPAPIVLGPLAQPLDQAPATQANQTYRITTRSLHLTRHFPAACRFMGEQGAAAVVSLSYFVGMVCPGLHSVFTSFHCQPSPGDAGSLEFLVRRYDHRFQLFDITFKGCIQGGIRAFVRPPPQAQATLDEIESCVRTGEFAGSHSLVIGGSRGLGELCAKILAAGGARVTISYASGSTDAQRIQDEICASGNGECHIQRLDLTAPNLDWAQIVPADTDTIYFFATPRIFRKKVGLFDADLFREFSLYYLERFHDLCRHLEERPGDRRVKVFLPSTVFITDRPKGMAEYAMAKAAAEILVEEINGSFKNVFVVSARLPRLNTDQTASIFKQATESNLDVMLPIIRSLQENASA